MTKKQIIFVPGKNPNPEEALHSKLLWRTLVEGVRRADSAIADTLQDSYANSIFLTGMTFIITRIRM
ncbi:MAG: Uncharacterized protein AWT59_2838 [Candidatus Gallionella acididurans]|uniref:Uncharacterized protein n=1 Tax=Candidatus Gallionella acididurans TaxID=1796491 RepID=A0A139BPY7_9PROT|nr:MAG: Uncharacterized protein AWT59_2838 [Candidatus Gallionella acididurans]